MGGDGGGRWTGGFFRGVLRAPLVPLFVGQRLNELSVKEDQKTKLPTAIRYLEERHPRGKVVITV